MSELQNPIRLFDLRDRVAIVTGASSGIGERLARALAGAGARVVLAARRRERLDGIAAALREAGAEAMAVRCDVAREDEVDRLIGAAVDSHGRIDVLVNGAGIAPPEDGEIESPASFRTVLDVNLTGTYLCARAAATVMLEQGAGAIVNVASISGLVAGDGPDSPSYVASKGAVVNLTRELGVRWATRGVRVNAIAPGWFWTEMTAAELESEEGLRFVTERTPMGRPGRLEELEGALLFLASDASAYVTGQTLVVDGGWTAR